MKIYCNIQKIPGVVAFFSAKDIPGDNSFTSPKAGFPEIVEMEAIFVELDTEIAFYGQPCGVIVANTMALAHSAAAHIEIMYEQTQQQQPRPPIIPSIFDWIEARDRNLYKAENQLNRLPPNQGSPLFVFGSHQRVKGDFRLNIFYILYRTFNFFFFV